MKFRKKPVVIEAIRFKGNNCAEIFSFMGNPGSQDSLGNGTHFRIKTLEGNMDATVGDWIIKGIKGEFYPCKPDIFEATYEKVEALSEDDSFEIEEPALIAMAKEAEDEEEEPFP